MELSYSALASGNSESLHYKKCQHSEFPSNICWCNGECHLAANTATKDAVALSPQWCSTSTRQDETDQAAWI